MERILLSLTLEEKAEIYTALLQLMRELKELWEETGNDYTAKRITIIKRLLEKLK